MTCRDRSASHARVSRRLPSIAASLVALVALGGCASIELVGDPEPTPAAGGGGDDTTIYSLISPDFLGVTDADWADWDGDGDLDVIVGKGLWQENRNVVYARESDGLVLAWEAPDALATIAVAWGDYDGDGDPDLAVANRDGMLQILTNTGGDLVMAFTINFEEELWDLSWGDPDGTGRDLLAVARDSDFGFEGSGLEVYEVTETAITQVWDPDDAAGATGVAWGDVDGDGLDELGATGGEPFGGPVRVYSGGIGGFSLLWTSSEEIEASRLAFGDADGDGDNDIGVSGGDDWPDDAPAAVVFENLGASSFALSWADPNPLPGLDADFGDLCGGGAQAFSTASFGTMVAVPGSPAPWRAPHAMGGESVHWLDWDGDGDEEPAVIGNIYAFPANGDAAEGALKVFDPHFTFDLDRAPGPPTESDPAVRGAASYTDWDGDGDPDVTLGAAGGSPLRVFQNNGGTLELVFEYAGTGQTFVSWGDADGDGDLDLTAAGAQEQPSMVFSQEPGPTFSLLWTSSENHFAWQTAWADWDGDGDEDLAVSGGFGPRPNYVYENDGDGGMTLAWTSPEAEHTATLEWGDYDGNGTPDLAVGGGFNDGIRIYENTGGALSSVWLGVAGWVADLLWDDVDNDGDLDLIAAAGDVRLYRNDDGAFTEVWTAGLAGDPTSLQLVDVDDDGDDELYVTRSGVSFTGLSDLVFAWDGAGFELVGWTPWAEATSHALVADWDGDGTLELREHYYPEGSALRPFVSGGWDVDPCAGGPANAP